MSDNDSGNELIFVSLENWDDIWRRNQFVCATLIERNPKLKILFVQPALDVSNALRTGRFKLLLQPRERTIDADGRIVCTRGLKLLPNSWTWARKVNEWMLRRHLQSVSRELGFHHPVLWLNPHAAVHLAGHVGECAVIYDITDDWSEPTQSAALRRLTIAQDEELCQRADAVIVCSEKLREKKQPLTRHLHLVPNGVDPDHYATANDREQPLPAEAQQWRRPVLGYAGSVHPERVDIPLVEAIARRLPMATLVFVGPLMLPENDLKRLAALPNVVLAGSRPYAQLPAYVRAFDICMTPHVVTPFTESLNPIKLWEYLAIGKPIISTPVAGFRDYPQFVYLASDADQFAAAVGEALSEDHALTSGRRAEAANHSWNSRVRQIEGILKPLPKQLATQPSRRPDRHNVNLLLRALSFINKRWRLAWVRIRHPSATIGARCDFRTRFDLRVETGAQVRIGERCVLDNDMVIEVSGRLEIGARTIFGHHCTLAASEAVTIGEDCLIAELVSIRDHDHCCENLEIPIREQGKVSAPVRIGRNVWIGCKATIVKGVTIGDNAVIGANAVVTGDVPANAIAAGVPARVIRFRTGARQHATASAAPGKAGVFQ